MFTLQFLADSLNATKIRTLDLSCVIRHIIIDSRKLIFVENALFIAIKGKHNDAHLYIRDAYDAGIRNFILEQKSFHIDLINELPDANILLVEKGLEALQQTAILNREQFNIPVIAITGSNGKTIVKEWLYHLLKDHFQIIRNPKSYNSQIGVPLSVLQIHEQHTLGIFEAGISEPNEMVQLEKIIQPSIGIFTMIGDAHDQGFANKEQKIAEKLKLFAHCKQLIYCMDQPLVQQSLIAFSKQYPYCTLIGWSRVEQEGALFIKVEPTLSGTQLSLANTTTAIPFTDEASVWNACACLALVYSLKTNDVDTISRFQDLPVLDMRLQLKEAHNNCLLINDSYSADLGSLNIALDFLKQHAGTYKRTVILSDILESGKRNPQLYSAVEEALTQAKIDKVIGIGSAIQSQAHLFKQKEVLFFADTKAFLSQSQLTNFHNEIILLKGARSFTFEKIGRWLERKVHQTVFEINLNAMVNNLNVYKSYLDPNVKVMAMVKAFSYGTGSYEIAKLLAFYRVDYLTVAYADEGIVLRKSGIKIPIMVMNPEPHSFNSIIENNLEPEIYNFEILDSLIIAADGEEISIHIEIDTGMKRLGFDKDQLSLLLAILKQNPAIKVKSVFTHLAASEASEHDDFSLQQISRFEEMANYICEAFPYKVLKHCLNSAGIIRYPHAHFDMVRLGIGLYGIDPTDNIQQQLQSIGTLKTVISQIRHIDAYESIGYGRKGHLPSGGKIAIVAIGYADGLSRKLSNGNGYMMVNGKRAFIVGSICMDMTMLDVTDIDCKPGDEVIVFGEQPHLIELSLQAGTIPYEILTSISQRVKRIYYYE